MGYNLSITSAKEIDVNPSGKAIIIQVPYRQLKNFHTIHHLLVGDLEKKIPGRDVVFVANRSMVCNTKMGLRKRGPRSHTLSSVQEAILNDVVFPMEIVGKRNRYNCNGTQTLKVYLDPMDKNTAKYKLNTFASVYQSLTGKDAVFDYHSRERAY